MITHYLEALMAAARYEIVEDDASIWGEIPGCKGVWANEKTLTSCQVALREALESWLLVKLSKRQKLPKAGKIDLNASCPA